MDPVTAVTANAEFSAGLAIAGVLYFVPTLVAVKRNANTGPVVVINVFLGWTLLGWVAALALAVAGKPSAAPYAATPSPNTTWVDNQALTSGIEAGESSTHHS